MARPSKFAMEFAKKRHEGGKKLPIEVMFDKLDDALSDYDEMKAVAKPDQMAKFRDHVIAIADRVSRFVHPTLQAMTMTGDDDGGPLVVEVRRVIVDPLNVVAVDPDG